MYITIETAQFLSLSSMTMKSGSDPRIHFLGTAIRGLVAARQEDVNALMKADRDEVKSELAQDRLPTWWIKLVEFSDKDRYYRSDGLGVYIGHIESTRREHHENTHAFTPIIEEARTELSRLSDVIYSQDVIDAVAGFCARVDDAMAVNKTNMSITKDLYDTLSRHAKS